MLRDIGRLYLGEIWVFSSRNKLSDDSDNQWVLASFSKDPGERRQMVVEVT